MQYRLTRNFNFAIEFFEELRHGWKIIFDENDHPSLRSRYRDI
jgi:hypothetical protein